MMQTRYSRCTRQFVRAALVVFAPGCALLGSSALPAKAQIGTRAAAVYRPLYASTRATPYSSAFGYRSYNPNLYGASLYGTNAYGANGYPVNPYAASRYSNYATGYNPMVALTGSAAASQSTGSRAGAQSASQSSSSVSAQQIAPDQRLQDCAAPVGRGAYFWLVRSLQAVVQGLRVVARTQRKHDLPGDDAPDASAFDNLILFLNALTGQMATRSIRMRRAGIATTRQVTIRWWL